MEGEKTFTLEQVLAISISELSAISIKATDAETVGKPICSVIANLKCCIEAIRAQEQEQKKPEEETATTQDGE